MSARPDILALGEPLIEFLSLPETPDGEQLYRQGFGGDTSNAIIAAARQGAATGYITAIGDDVFGRDLLGLWQREGVSTEFVQVRPDDPTGAYFVKPHASGRDFWYARRGSAASLFSAEDLPVAAIKGAKILHVSALSQAISPSMRDTVTRAAEIARKNGTLVSYDTNLRLNLWSLDEARATIMQFLPLADIVLPSDDEAATLLGTDDAEAIIERFGQEGAKIVLLKRGAEGALLSAGGRTLAVEGHPTDAVDSTGAGDSFAGAFLAYYLETGDAELAARRAAVVAAGTVSGYGAVDPIPRRADVLAVF